MTWFNELRTMSHFTFLSRSNIWALLVIPALLLFMVAISRRRSRYVVTFTNLEVLAGVTAKRRFVWRRWVALILLILALASAATALARPSATLVVPDQNATVILLVDVSGSMRASDVRPTRIAAAVTSMRLFLDQLPSQFRVGLVSFSSQPELLDDPTKDRVAIRNGLNFLAPQAGTAIGDGLRAAVAVAVASLADRGVRKAPGELLPATIVLESDGKQNQGVLQPRTAARFAKQNGIRVYGVSLGTPGGKVTFGTGAAKTSIPVPPDPTVVQQIARDTGGKAFAVQDAAALNQVYKDLGGSIGRKVVSREITSWFAILAALLLVGAVGIARLWGSSLP